MGGKLTFPFSSSNSGPPCFGPFGSGSLQIGHVTDAWHTLSLPHWVLSAEVC